METKVCKACLEEKELSEFGKDSNQKDSLRYRCKECDRSKKPSVHVELVGEIKPCCICKEEKDLSSFYKRSDRDYKYEPKCIKCSKKGLKVDAQVFKEGQKKCSICQVYKPLEDFHKKSETRSGVVSHCKNCSQVKSKDYRKSLPEDIRKQRKREEYLKNKTRYIQNSKEWKENNKERSNEIKNLWTKKRLKTDEIFKLRLNIRALIKITFSKSLNGITYESGSSKDILGCSIEDFKIHLERQFLPWMNWSNYGNCEGNEYNCSWHLDHIIPISLAETKEEIYLLNHWSNFQPLCSRVNQIEKRDNVYPCTNLELGITIEENKIIKNK